MNFAEYIEKRRWFRGKARKLASAVVEEEFPLDLAGERVSFSIVRCTYEDGPDERYVLPLAETTGEAPERLVVGKQGAVTFYDALGSERLLGALLDKFKGGGTRVGSGKGTLAFRPLPGFDKVSGSSVAPKIADKEQTNTSIAFGDAYILKIVRKLDEGRSAELEMGELLTRQGYASTPAVLGAIEIERGPKTEASTVGIVHRFLPNRGDAWAFTLELLARSPAPEAYVPHAERLGERVGEMHVVLAQATGPSFAPEPLDRDARERLAGALRSDVADLRAHLREGDEARIETRLAAFVALDPDPVAMRVHGDLHLGQILATDDDFVIIDFEGEPARPLAERKAKRSPMADVAGMLRSFDYAAATALRASSKDAARAWREAASAAFLRKYRESAGADTPREVLDFYLLEKCAYEMRYEANNRPDWIAIPQEGLFDLLDVEGGQ